MELTRINVAFLVWYMPILFSAALNGVDESVRYFHVPIVGFYLGAARDFARSCIDQKEDDDGLVRNVICSITFSAMAVEALINEATDEMIPSGDRNAFDKGLKPFKRASKQSLVMFKYVTLVERYKSAIVPDAILAGIKELVEIRNTLVHYKPEDTAGKYIMGPAIHTPTDDGGIMISFDFTRPPRRIQPPFVQNLSRDVAIRSYNTAMLTIKYWHGLCDLPWSAEVFPELSSAN